MSDPFDLMFLAPESAEGWPQAKRAASYGARVADR